MWTTTRRLAVTGVVLLTVTFAIANPAMAVVEKSGSTNCEGVGPPVRLQSLGTGHVEHYWPSGASTSNDDWHNGSDFVMRHSNTHTVSTSWRMTATGLLSNGNTFAYCTPH
jgi:hypothetical protein